MPKAPKVTPIHVREREAEPPPPPLTLITVRWIVPQSPPPSYAHAYLVGGTPPAVRTLCKGHRIEGAIYPPADGLQRCPECAKIVDARTKSEASDG